MRDIFGPLTWISLGAVVLLCGLYFALTQAFPEWSAPELQHVREDLSSAVDERPREGKVVPSDVVANEAAELTVDEFSPRNSRIAGYDAAQINHLAQGLDGQKHPANSYLKGFVPFATDKYWVPLMAVTMRVRYIRDDAGTVEKDSDIWQTSAYTYKDTWGDCEDAAILLADWMIGLGYDARVVGGKVNDQGHAWVVLENGGEEYLLEATDKGSRRSFPLTRLHPEYVPMFMFNRDHFWLRNRKMPYQFSEPEEPWLLTSDFIEESAGK